MHVTDFNHLNRLSVVKMTRIFPQGGPFFSIFWRTELEFLLKKKSKIILFDRFYEVSRFVFGDK